MPLKMRFTSIFTCHLQTLFVITSYVPLSWDIRVTSTTEIPKICNKCSSNFSVIAVLVTVYIGTMIIDTMELCWKINFLLYVSEFVIYRSQSWMNMKLLLWPLKNITISFFNRKDSSRLKRFSKAVVEIRFAQFPLPIVLWCISKARMQSSLILIGSSVSLLELFEISFISFSFSCTIMNVSHIRSLIVRWSEMTGWFNSTNQFCLLNAI